MRITRTVPLILLLAGCASAGASSLLTMSDVERERLTLSRQPPPHERCSQSETAPRYAPAQLVDTASLAAHARTIMSGDDHMLVSIAWDSTGTAQELNTIETTMGRIEADALRQRIGSVLRLPLARGRHRLRMDGDGSLRTARSVGCAPYLVNRESLGRILEHMVGAANLGKFVQTARTAVIWIRVGPDGTTSDARVETSSGYPELDAMALEAAKQGRFLPPSIDRVPMEAWASIPMQFRVPPRTDRRVR